MKLLDREGLEALLDDFTIVSPRRVSEVRARLRTICSNCGREGAPDRYDREGIYAGRWHDGCATPSDTHRANYRWSPGDEPLEEE